MKHRRLVALLLFVAVHFGLAVAEEECRVRIENRFSGLIAVSRDRGATWTPIGKVVRPNLGFTAETDDKGFTASDWAPDGSVAATAVNAIHIKVGQGKRHAVLFSLQPKDLMLKTADEIKSYYSTPTSIFTDIPAGHWLFGKEAAPRLGNPVWVERDGKAGPMPADYKPRLKDALILPSMAPKRALREVHVTNRANGLVRVVYSDGAIETWARVEKPMSASGRFGGTQYAGPGQVRANHPGVLCVSTSPLGEVGGFQIVPSVHAREANLAYIWTSGVGAWMVVGPLKPSDGKLEGKAPLFSGHLRPATGTCEVKMGDDKWRPVPVSIGKNLEALKGVTELRIRFEE